MKVAIVTVGELPIPDVRGGGAETLIEHIIEKNEQYKELDIIVYSIYDELAEKKSKTFKKTEFVYLSLNKKILLKRLKRKAIKLISGFDIPIENYSYSKVLKDILRRNVNVVIIENTMVPYVKYSRKLKKKLLLHTHWDYINNTLPALVLNGYKKALRKSSGVITVSDYIKKCILTVPEITSENVSVLKNCTDLSRFGMQYKSEELMALREKNGISQDDFVFIFCGRISPEKGALELAKAFNKLHDKNKVKLLLVGSAKTGHAQMDSYTENVHNELKQSSDHVVITGYIPNQDMPMYYQMSNVAVLPSINDDPAPLTIFESMASGLPIITTYSGGIPEYADKQCAIFCHKDERIVSELSDAMDIVRKDSELVLKMQQHAKERVKIFNTDQYYKDLLQILRERMNHHENSNCD